MLRRGLKGLCGIALMGTLAATDGTYAATVSILSGSVEVMPNEAIALKVSGTGFSSSADGGDFTISWDPSVLSYIGFSVADPPWDTSFINVTDVATGILNSVSVADSAFGGPGAVFDIGTLSFTVVGGIGDSTAVSIADGLVGWVAPGVVPITTTYNSASVKVVPIPATAYLLLSGVVGLVAIGRRKR